ncbi:hypothetical protein AB0I84_10495 [Streptomyces spectabilis]|uniref:hypothetical protein n=1 Tax=Streptomyces spectabilis TaxID=68270 RepID=UPI0033F712C6
MGAIDFFTSATGPDLTTAFNTARAQDRNDYGSGGYTGTLAEKHSVALIDEPRRSEGDAVARARELLLGDDPRVSDKWGPAGALPIATDDGTDGWLLFGVAPY